ncbi:MAG: metallophosphoesterase [Armatimonadetes bacterium]|nr:metallophosphoesterase [Armatimonadota bacterium]
MIRFIHTGDWQLGMTRHFFSEGPQERYSQARFDAIRTIGRVAEDEECRFVLVCGDAFESNQVDRKTVARALEALKEVPVPVFILPGNHDPLDAASVYRSSTFVERKPEQVHVIESSDPLIVSDGIELVGAPWLSKRPVANPIHEALSALVPATGVTRICAGHGMADSLAPDRAAAGVIEIEALERAIDENKVHFVALGDRHSLTEVGTSGRIWYAGTPEPTDFSETASGCVLVVEIDDDVATTREVRTGQWRFIERRRVDVNSDEDVEVLRQWLEGIQSKERTVIRLHLVGSVSLSARVGLETCLSDVKDIFGAFDVRETDLLVVPDNADFADLRFSGFADGTVHRLRAKIEEGGDEAPSARDGLMLLLRLAEEGE